MSALKTQVDTQLTALTINTYAEVQAFRKLPYATGNMATVLAAIKSALSKSWIGRRQVRKWALPLYRNGEI